MQEELAAQAERSGTSAMPEEPPGDWGFRWDDEDVETFARLMSQGLVSFDVDSYFAAKRDYPGFLVDVSTFIAVRRKQVHRAKEMLKGGR